jgi:murein L,D-transpeptidase YcbB/YkuD
MALVYLEGATPSTSRNLTAVGQSLAALGYLDSSRISDTYTAHYADAIKKFQRDYGYTADGVLTTALEAEIKNAYLSLGKARATSTTSSVANVELSSERTDTFFHSGQKTLTRRNNQDIKIVVGEQKQQIKTLKNVYFRSKGLVVDASGNPIAEQFEFIARDLVES